MVAVGVAPAGNGGQLLGVSGASFGVGGLQTVPLMPRSGGGQFLGEVTRGYEVDWSDCCMLPDQADCVLVMLGLLHMRVKCMIPEELGGNYMPEMSGMWPLLDEGQH